MFGRRATATCQSQHLRRSILARCRQCLAARNLHLVLMHCRSIRPSSSIISQFHGTLELRSQLLPPAHPAGARRVQTLAMHHMGRMLSVRSRTKASLLRSRLLPSLHGSWSSSADLTCKLQFAAGVMLSSLDLQAVVGCECHSPADSQPMLASRWCRGPRHAQRHKRMLLLCCYFAVVQSMVKSTSLERSG